MKRSLAAGLFALLALPAFAEEAAWAPSTFTLDNGMDVVVIPDHRAPVVTHMVWYKVGAADETTGQGIVAFVILRGGIEHADGDALVTELRNHVAKEIGPIAKPRQIMVVPELPKTRSGKIMRRLLRDVAEHRALGDATTLADPAVMALITEGLATATPED